jgi:hypothetical protein
MWTIRLLQHCFSLTPDLIDIPVAARSECDLGIHEERSGHLLAAQGKPPQPRKNVIARQRFSFQTSSGRISCSPRTPYALIVKDQMTLLPVRIPQLDINVVLFLRAMHLQ